MYRYVEGNTDVQNQFKMNPAIYQAFSDLACTGAARFLSWGVAQVWGKWG